MASLIFAHAKSIYNKAKKHESELRDIHGDDTDVSTNIARFIERERAKFRDILTIAQLLHEDYVEITGSKTNNWYFVTVRPKPTITFEDFYILTYKYCKRAFMLEYKLAFEQKSNDGTGEGFHVHIVCNTKHRSKGECLRDTISSFAKVCEPNCIEVKVTRNPDDIVNKYLLAYESEDGHKIATKNGDAIWRTKMNIADLYENDLPRAVPLLSSSPETARISEDPIIIQLN